MGPLAGIRIIEVASLGPGPFCAMMLADMGADVIRVDRPGPDPVQHLDPLRRSRRSVALNLKSDGGRDALLRLADGADALLEGFRPGVAERLGFGPEVCLGRNPKLVYGRVTGWGQQGPLAGAAGHDLNYIALAGALHGMGRPGAKPMVPLNLVGDFGGGGMLLAFGMVCALLEARRSGRGQVVDAAMVDGANALMAMFHGLRAMGRFDDAPGSHFLAGAAHFYDTYETSDGKYVSIAALEPAFYDVLIDKAGLDRDRFGGHGFYDTLMSGDTSAWPALKSELERVMRSRTRDEWCRLLEGSDACFAPVLTLAEAATHPHNRARQTHVDVSGVTQHAPAPRFSRSSPDAPQPSPRPGRDSREILAGAGFSNDEISQLLRSGAASQT
jgi:alpha-methylacyl-CoA racemase